MKFCDQVTKPIIDSVRKGNYLNTAVRASGLSYRTVMKWMSKGRAGQKPYDKFYQDIQEAEAFFESMLVDSIIDSGNPKYHLEILARRNSNNWAATQRVQKEVDVQITDFLEFLMEELSPYPESKSLVVGIASRYESREDQSAE
ncbi:MAG: hypothetical protein RLZZ171_1768 [Cyanobacteriota bacterium]|jgi:hypothetical protein